MRQLAFVVAACAVASCALDLQAPPDVVHARFDPTASVLPMPNDMVRDQSKHVLALPIPDDVSPAEKELRGWLNTQDGFLSTFTATIDFDAPIEASTVDSESVKVWR